MKILFISFILPVCMCFPQGYETPSTKTCGYQSCHPIKKDMINVHIVAHTHDDVGWLKTVDQYYYGGRKSTQNAAVETILDSVVQSLKKNKDRRFIYVETAFFWKWWMKQHDTVKSLVRRLVNTGQLEFIGGGWSMNDEATTNYQSIINNFEWGLRKLNDSFGECGRPKVGWQIDPFGHSREMASIFAQLGFDGVLLGRIDYQDKLFRMITKTPEMVWRSSQSLGPSSEIFTGVLYNTYSPPRGFCFDILCDDDPIIDDKKSPDYNVERRVDDIFAYVKNLTSSYATHNVLITMGEDFQYQDAEVWFRNLDKLIQYANQRQYNGSKYNLIYSTPSCYIKAIHDETNGYKKWPVKQDDFFPYASDPHAYWTGYFTSRPTLKRYEREGNNFLQVCKQLYTLADLGPEDRVDLNSLREAMGVLQHHDAITGTEKQHVAFDYARILSIGMAECEFIANTALGKLVIGGDKTDYADEKPTPSPTFTTCPLLNVSQCEFTESHTKAGKSFVVTIFNPLSRHVMKFIRLPVMNNIYKVRSPEGQVIIPQIIPIAQPIQNIPGRKSEAKIELVFPTMDLPPHGFRSYYVEVDNEAEYKKPNKKVQDASFGIDRNGILTAIYVNGQAFNLSQQFYHYEGYVGNNSIFFERSSGAYIFRPTGEAKEISESAKIKIYEGDHIAEVHQKFNDWVSQIIRVYSAENYVEFDWLIGPLPINKSKGIEVVTRYSSEIESDTIFYTDSNGRETLKRTRNSRPTWNLSLTEPIAANYYPVTSKISIKDRYLDLGVLTDRAQGGTSLRDGEIELMLHRACIHDDGFGVNEPLMEKAFDEGLVVRGSHYVIFGINNPTDTKTFAANSKKLAQEKLLTAWTFLSSPGDLSFEEYSKKYKMEYDTLTMDLPQNVQLLTLEPWIGNSFLIRLEHIMENGEDPVLSKPVSVNLNEFFLPFKITSMKETTLGGNQWLSDNERLRFDIDENLENFLDNTYDTVENKPHTSEKRSTVIDATDALDEFIIKLNPMQIRTFIVNIKKT